MRKVLKFNWMGKIAILALLGLSTNCVHENIEEEQLIATTLVSNAAKAAVESPNLALGKTAEQSSTDYGGVPNRAVDGNTSGVWNQGSVTHTKRTSRPWWQVRLGEEL